MALILPFILSGIILFLIAIFIAIYGWRKISQLLRFRKEVIPGKTHYEFSHINDQKSEVSLQHKFDQAVIVHGTFVGDDPFHIQEYLENIFPSLRSSFSKKIKRIMRNNNEFLAKDLGNFTKMHESIIDKKLIHNGHTHSLVWSSANSHLARVNGLVSLIRLLREKVKKKESLFLIAHSHGGQIFALYTQVFTNFEHLEDLLKASNKLELFDELKKGLAAQRQINMVMVTLGTPVRYKWVQHEKIQLIHIINHRSELPYGGDLKGSLFTEYGDYVQQWAVSGSDSYIARKVEREVNQRLDLLLDIGCDLKLLQVELSKRKRIHNLGHHMLIDLNDKGVRPNFFKTIFGHGTYTKLDIFTELLNHISFKLNQNK